MSNPITVAHHATTGTYTIGGSNGSGTAAYTGNITLNQPATLQAAAGGTVDFSSGTWTTNNMAITIGSAGNTGTVELDQGISTSGGITVSYGALALDSAFTGSVNYTSQSSSTFGGTIAGGGNTLSLNGAAAMLTLAGNNPYSGATAVNGGTLDIGPTGSVASPAINVGTRRGVDRGVRRGHHRHAHLAASGTVNSTIQPAR